MSSTVSTFDLPDLNQRVAALQWYIDAARTGAIAPDDPIHLKTGLLTMDLQAVAARLAPKNTCVLTYPDMARAINFRNPGAKCRDTTLRKLQVFQYLDDKGIGEGIGYQTNLPGQTKTKTKTKFSEEAVAHIAAHYTVLKNEYGWR
ncbi:MAG: hypothetical protein ACYDDD_01425 [Acidithiobacillus ferrivorans]|nr:hypothetical protein [Acidithiobacillus ferrivorans]